MIQSRVVKADSGYWARVPSGAVPQHGPPPVKSIPPERRRRLTHRAFPALGGLAAVSMVAGAMVGSTAQSTSERVAGDFAAAWERGDLREMHDLLSAPASRRFPIARFRRAYTRAP